MKKDDNGAWDECEKARRQFEDANEAYGQMLDRYFPVSAFVPGEPIKSGQTLTLEAFAEIEEVEKQFEDARRRLREATRRLQQGIPT